VGDPSRNAAAVFFRALGKAVEAARVQDLAAGVGANVPKLLSLWTTCSHRVGSSSAESRLKWSKYTALHATVLGFQLLQSLVRFRP
jgi:hypothetical protein